MEAHHLLVEGPMDVAGWRPPNGPGCGQGRRFAPRPEGPIEKGLEKMLTAFARVPHLHVAWGSGVDEKAGPGGESPP